MSDNGNKYRPFHEVIVDAIHGATQSQLGCLGALLSVTKVPKNHDAIIAAWKAKTAANGYSEHFMGVLESLQEQKAQAAGTDGPSKEKKGQPVAS